MEQVLSVSLTAPTPSDEDVLFIEQQEWDAYIDKMTKASVINALRNFMRPDTTLAMGAMCGGQDGVYDTELYVYFYNEPVPYTLYVTEGELGDATIEDLRYREMIKVKFGAEFESSYPIVSVSEDPYWLGAVYNKNGEEIPPPPITVEGNKIYTDEDCFGAIMLTYFVHRHKYPYKMTSLQGASISYGETQATIQETKYFTVAYAVYDGGIEGLELKAPQNFEQTDGNCYNGGEVFTEPDEEDPPPKVEAENTETDIDYCTGRKIEY